MMNETPEPTVNETTPSAGEREPTDIFAWANQTDAAKNSSPSKSSMLFAFVEKHQIVLLYCITINTND